MKIKKAALAVLAAIFMISCASCEKAGGEYFAYQKYPLSFSADTDIDGTVYSADFKIEGKDDFSVSFTAPSELCGYSFKRKEGALYICFGELEMPLDETVYKNGTAALAELFFLRKDDIRGANVEELDGMTLNVVEAAADFGEAKIYVSSETGEPIRIEADMYGRNIVMNIRDFACMQAGV